MTLSTIAKVAVSSSVDPRKALGNSRRAARQMQTRSSSPVSRNRSASRTTINALRMPHRASRWCRRGWPSSGFSPNSASRQSCKATEISEPACKASEVWKPRAIKPPQTTLEMSGDANRTGRKDSASPWSRARDASPSPSVTQTNGGKGASCPGLSLIEGNGTARPAKLTVSAFFATAPANTSRFAATAFSKDLTRSEPPGRCCKLPRARTNQAPVAAVPANKCPTALARLSPSHATPKCEGSRTTHRAHSSVAKLATSSLFPQPWPPTTHAPLIAFNAAVKPRTHRPASGVHTVRRQEPTYSKLIGVMKSVCLACASSVRGSSSSSSSAFFFFFLSVA